MPETPEKPTEVAREAARGRSERTPWLALGGVWTAAAIAFCVVVLIAGLVYALN